MGSASYLLSYGKAGEFGVFHCSKSNRYNRGEQVVVESCRGLELGLVMGAAREGHARLLNGRHSGEILRYAGFGDLETSRRLQKQGEVLFHLGRRLARSLALPLEIFDTEILLDGQSAILYVVRAGDCDLHPLLEALYEHRRLPVTVHDLGPGPIPSEVDDSAEFGTCGGGSCGNHGCGSCGSGCQSCKSGPSNGPANAAPVNPMSLAGGCTPGGKPTALALPTRRTLRIPLA